jgi:hypothetical protein
LERRSPSNHIPTNLFKLFQVKSIALSLSLSLLTVPPL